MGKSGKAHKKVRLLQKITLILAGSKAFALLAVSKLFKSVVRQLNDVQSNHLNRFLIRVLNQDIGRLTLLALALIIITSVRLKAVTLSFN